MLQLLVNSANTNFKVAEISRAKFSQIHTSTMHVMGWRRFKCLRVDVSTFNGPLLLPIRNGMEEGESFYPALEMSSQRHLHMVVLYKQGLHVRYAQRIPLLQIEP